jgi:hypothetical protein
VFEELPVHAAECLVTGSGSQIQADLTQQESKWINIRGQYIISIHKDFIFKSAQLSHESKGATEG